MSAACNAGAPRTMQAARIRRFGGPEVIELDAIDIPSPGPEEILVRVGAAGVGAWDAWVRAGQSKLAQTLPLTLGSDIAGTVEAIGPGVADRTPGERVFGVTNGQFSGGYAQYALAKASSLAHLPDAIDLISAASVPVISVTAWQMLFRVAHIKSGWRVLVHGAAGNVGAYALPLIHVAGATAIASVLADDAPYARKLGADEAIELGGDSARRLEGSFDAVLDFVGGNAQSQLFRYLKAGGVLVSAVAEPDARLAKHHQVRATFFLVDVTTADLNSIISLLDSGRIKARVGETLPLSGARTAHEMLDGLRPKPKAKIVLNV